MADTPVELKWLRDLLRDMNIQTPLHIPIYYDSKSIISITTNLVFESSILKLIAMWLV